MSQERLEADSGDQPRVVRTAFDAAVEQADGDMADAVGAITDPLDALAFVYGYRDLIVATSGIYQSEAHGLVIAKIGQHIVDSSGSDSDLINERRELWDPVFDAVKRKEELNSPATWERLRDAVHLFDQADERFLQGA